MSIYTRRSIEETEGSNQDRPKNQQVDLIGQRSACVKGTLDRSAHTVHPCLTGHKTWLFPAAVG